MAKRETNKKSAFQETWLYSALLKIYAAMFAVFLCIVRGIKKLIGFFI